LPLSREDVLRALLSLTLEAKMLLRRKALIRFTALPALLPLLVASHANAQQPGYPPPQQQPAPQPYPQAPPQQGYPQPLQPLPPQQQQPQYPPPQYPQQPPAQTYPQPQPAPQPTYPQQGYPPPQTYPQQPYPQQQLPPPGYQQPPPPGYQQQVAPPGYAQMPPPPGYMPPPPAQPLAPPVPDGKRDQGEMMALYTTSILWGVGSGIWIDGLANISDPAIGSITPLVLGAAAPIAMYVWDNYDNFDRGVPSSIATGLTLGAIEGIAISGTQWQNTGNGGPNTWNFQTQSSMTWALSTAGGVGGFLYGEWFKPDPRSLSFIVSGAGWGAMSGLLIGAGAESPSWAGGSGTNAPQSFGDGASVGGLIGYNGGILATGVLTVAGYTPSWRAQQAMWLGYFLGTAAGSLVYLGYIGQPDVHHGMIANGIGGLAGIGIAAVLTANTKDTAKAWIPPIQVGVAPTGNGGAALSAYGTW
jgi:hypothetical protein